MDRPHDKLLSWQKSVECSVLVCKLARAFPREEPRALKSQARRGAVSVPVTVSEGPANRSRDEPWNCLGPASGPLKEMTTVLEISRRVGYLKATDFMRARKLADECLALTFSLRKSLAATAHRSPFTAP